MSGLFLYRGAGAPEGADFTIAGGQTSTPTREVSLTLSSHDHVIGANNVTDVKVWGDVQPGAHTHIGTLEADSDWMRFTPSLPIVLSAGPGTKTINAQIRNAAMLATATITRTITLTDGTPHVSILWKSDRRTIRSGEVGQIFTLAWSSSHAFTAFEVWSVNNLSAARGEGTLLTSGGSGTAGETKTTVLDQDDFDSMNGTGVRMGKVFVQVGGIWYS